MDDSKKYIEQEGWLSILLNLILFGLKYWAGIVTGSLAIIADAWHTLTDSVSSIIVLIGGRLSRKPPDKEHPFGHGRAEHIVAIIIGVLLALVAFEFILDAFEKFKSREKTSFGTIAWVVTIVSIIGKEAMAQYAFWAAKKTKSSILKADGWHHRTDALSSVIILLGIIASHYFWWVDAVLGFIVACMIGWASYHILSGEIKALLGESPSDEHIKEIIETGEACCNMEINLHHINIHNYGNHSELSCHIKLPPGMPLVEAHEICTKIENAINSKFGYIVTIHPEPRAI